MNRSHNKNLEKITCYQREIVQRFLSTENFKQFCQDYADARKTKWSMALREATPVDRKILKDHKAGMIISELRRKYNLRRDQIFLAIAVASRD